MLSWRNPHNGRRYAVRVERDLFGTLVLTHIYSGEHAHKGRIFSTPIPYGAVRQYLRAVCQRRRAHGYALVRKTPT